MNFKNVQMSHDKCQTHIVNIKSLRVHRHRLRSTNGSVGERGPARSSGSTDRNTSSIYWRAGRGRAGTGAGGRATKLPQAHCYLGSDTLQMPSRNIVSESTPNGMDMKIGYEFRL
jgi:hypothetical protein